MQTPSSPCIERRRKEGFIAMLVTRDIGDDESALQLQL